MIYSPGARVVFSHPNNGHSHDQRLAAAHLTEGAVYTVEKTEVGGWESAYVLKEIPGVRFNTVLFSGA